MIDTIEGRGEGCDGVAAAAAGAVAAAESTSRARYERKRQRGIARMHSRAHKSSVGGMMARRNWNLLVCSKSALLNDVPMEKRLDVRYWMD